MNLADFNYWTASIEVTPKQVKDYINDESQPIEYRNKLKEFLERYERSTIKGKTMYVDRLGNCVIWF